MHITTTTTRRVALVTALAVTAVGCASGEPAASTAATRTVTVFSAASMKTTFTELGDTFEKSRPGVTVTFDFAGSQDLATQLTGGAAADVFAAANEATMKTVTDAGLAAGEPSVYATNQLMIAVPPDNPAGIDAFSDLAAKGLRLVVCAPAVPCGAATERIEKATGVTLNPVSEEDAVTGVLEKVRTGEADAGLVYRTDVKSAGDSVRGIAFPESAQAITRNVIVALSAGPQAALGQEFVDLVLSEKGQEVLNASGFGAAG